MPECDFSLPYISGNQTLCTDATKKGEIVTVEDDRDSLDEWIQEQAAFQSTLLKLAFVQVHDFPDSEDEDEEISKDWKLVPRDVDEVFHEEMKIKNDDEDVPYSVIILPAAAGISRQVISPHVPLTAHNLEFDSILSWGYDGLFERFWIGWEFAGVQDLRWENLNLLNTLSLHLTECINTSDYLSAMLAIERFHDICEDNMPRFKDLLKLAKMVAYNKVEDEEAESSQAAQQRHNRLEIIRSRGLEVHGWSNTGSSGFQFFLCDGSSFIINNNKEILHLNLDFLMAEMNIKEAWKAKTGKEWEMGENEEVPPPLSTPYIANEAEAEVSTSSLTSTVVIHEAEAEASNKDKEKGIMTEEEEEEKIEKEKKEKEKRRREGDG
ncbi:hypothetical protein L1987_54836 [Smallanthus sonchifolius]|uniref:Uncharacterized protein n=1 Tax=Smallanthus sonchifolius TaxID=185202 RepID=A0ACB9E8X7_9ASTR|nr:hypothetical protein L1987_54836 [Smallanthus sonchifolius]